MPDADSPSALSLIADALTRLEGKLDTGLSRLEAKLEAKADKADLARMEARLDQHQSDIGQLRQADALRAAKAEVHAERDQRSWWARTNKLKFFAGAVGTLSSLAIAAATCISLLAH